MIDRSLFNVEDFLVDNTFQLYCSGQDKRCVVFWENYIKAHPEQKEVITDAKGLYIILSGNKKPLNTQIDNLKIAIEQTEGVDQKTSIISIPKRYSWIKIAAAILIVAGISFFYKNMNPKETILLDKEFVSHFNAKDGERKKITLPDGSVVLLNSRSTLILHEDFNQQNREVELVGEAFFDVTNNKEKPFVVHTSDFDINVLGTSFNVKAYPEDATSEAVLIKGLIVMETKANEGSSITMKPSQKITLYKAKAFVHVSGQKVIKNTPQIQEIAINQYTQNEDNSIVEMAWTQNRLEMADQSFGELKNVLERWYNVQIQLNDKEVEDYRFTATFGNESIKEVLNALQKAEHFKYEIKENRILISK